MRPLSKFRSRRLIPCTVAVSLLAASTPPLPCAGFDR